jgi:hypothetical protein
MDEAATLEQYQWQFRDTSLWAVDAHSPAGGITAVQRVLENLGVYDMPFGEGVSLRNTRDLRSLRDGTVITQGDPADANRYRVYVMQDRSWQCVLGRVRSGTSLFTIREGSGLARPAWLDTEPEPDEINRIESWKKVAWKAGYAAKERHDWCPTFERVMEGLGIYG